MAVQDWISSTPISAGLVDQNSDAETDLITYMNNTKFYEKAEPGFTHPGNTSLIKLRNNGMIDIFTSTNQGIRIDPNTKTINMITNHLKNHLTYMTTWAEKDIIFNCHKYFNVNSDTDINLEAKKKINFKCEEWNVNIIGDINVKCDGTINIKSQGSTNIESSSTINIKGSSINFSGSSYNFE